MLQFMLRFTLMILAGIGVGYAAKSGSNSPADVLKQSLATDWRVLDPQNTLLMEVNGGQVLLELAPRFAPRHVANIRKLAHERYFDGLAVIRVQDNFVTQWGAPEDEDAAQEKPKSLGSAEAKLPAEFSIPQKGLVFTPLKDADGFSPMTGFIDGMPVAADPKHNQAWIPHCYGVIGAGRGNPVDSSNGSSLYAIIGQAPRALDRNITVVGRVVKGMEFLAALPRGGGAMGFYDKPEQHSPIRSVRLLADLPEAERPALELLRTDTRTWQAWVEARRHASGDWYVHSAEHINVCNISVPIRPVVQPVSLK
ncbi:peptidylprolyl isomerase [Chitinimonas sp. BJB300]|uniref:peptidylprolyl isomerase n=1 Tax=Chitinimonas sp. BJB300 TaxID=1559339 RepID=UPI002102813D|nr:peptidylprolyl isomerase [Chitinimonas sp. BJB300]